MVAGVLLSLGQCTACTASENAWAAVFKSLEQQGLTAASIVALLMQYLVQFSGATMFVGGLLSYKNHVRSGKEFVSLGTGVGLADLFLRVTTGTLAVYGSSAVLIGLILAVFASRHIHGPHATYAEEVHKLLSGLRGRLVRKRNAKRKRIRRGLQHASAKRRAMRPTLPGPNNVGYNKKREGQAAGKKDSTVGEP